MTHPMTPVCFDQADPAARGEAHGELWRAEIRELARIRTALSLVRGSFADEDELRAVAAAHLPVLERFDRELFAELTGIARGADLPPEDLVILNHYTDLRDVPPSALGRPAASDGDPGGCTAVYTLGDSGPLLGQTWDMHGTAEPFVRTIRVQPAGSEEEVLCFTLTGCLGMAGLGADGVAVTINNLTSTDARVGVVWPALVRKMLAQPTAVAAEELLMRTPLSSGHHYMIADGHTFVGVETSGELKVRTQTGARATHVHTNHCFDPVLRKRERVSPVSTTHRRMELVSTLIVQQPPRTARQMWELLASHEGHPRSLCSHVDDETGDPSASRTCGALVMELAGGRMLTARGCVREHDPIELFVERWRGLAAPREATP